MTYTAEQLIIIKRLIDEDKASISQIMEYGYQTQQAQRVRKAKFDEVQDENISQEDK